MGRKRSKPGRGHPPGQVRIIGGQWRGRRLPVPALPGLRPSGDRARETLFNWLSPWIAGARCLDLFAGTGVLGLEALSRGAGSCVLIERQRDAAATLRESVTTLGAGSLASVIEADAIGWLRGCSEKFDLVFIDPPYADRLWLPAMEAVTPNLSSRALVYCETPVDAEPGEVPESQAGLTLEKRKIIAGVQMRLFRKVANG